MISTEQIQPLLNDGVVVDDSGDKVGKVGQVYLDDQTGEPEWVTAATGFFGTTETFIPLQQATVTGSEVRVPYSKTMIKDAPRMSDADGHLSPEQEEELYRYYSLSQPTGTYETTQTTYETGDDTTRGVVGTDVSGRETDDSMTRSEEQLRVGTERVATGKARLRKFIVTENVTTTVPVQREEVRLEREPITDANRGAALSGADLSEEEHEVVLSEERVVVSKETVPVERVHLGKETVVENKEVTEQVRKEQIETDLDGNGTPDRR